MITKTLLPSYGTLLLKLNQTTPQTVINGAPLFNLGLKSPKIYPASDSTTAIQFNKADGSTNVLNIDTINGNVKNNIGYFDAKNYYYLNGNLILNMDGSGNTALGLYSLQSAESVSNAVALGYGSLQLTTGSNNVGIGYQALRLNTGGTNNVGIGFQAGYSNKTTGSCTFIGSQAGYNAIGTRLVFVGFQAGNKNTSGGYNTAVGNSALFTNTVGNNNFAMGSEALYLATGSDNVGIGTSAGYNLGGSVNNVFIGNQAGLGSGASYVSPDNTIIGYQSFYSIATGNGNNVGIGKSSGYSNVTGESNVFIGNEAGYYETGSNTLFIDNIKRTNEADGRIKALVYGVFASTAVGQSLVVNGRLGLNITPTAWVTLPAGTATAGTAPLKLTSGALLTAPEAGAEEFLTDDRWFTITTGTARKGYVFNDGTNLTSGKYPKASTNGRLIDGPAPLAGTKVYYVSDSSGGAVTRKLTFVDGILTAET